MFKRILDRMVDINVKIVTIRIERSLKTIQPVVFLKVLTIFYIIFG